MTVPHREACVLGSDLPPRTRYKLRRIACWAHDLTPAKIQLELRTTPPHAKHYIPQCVVRARGIIEDKLGGISVNIANIHDLVAQSKELHCAEWLSKEIS